MRILALTAVAAALFVLAVPPSGAQERTAGGTDGASATEDIILAGGCFWCVEADFDKVEGVLSTTSGYTGGRTENPTYEQVTYGDTGHYEAVRITYDPSVVTFRDLVDHFWRTVDPTDAGGQFCDRGESYRTAVFVADAGERAAAEASREEADALLAQDIVTPILDEATFYPAEAYHQDYYEKNPIRYRFYRLSCGRDARLEELWGEAGPS